MSGEPRSIEETESKHLGASKSTCQCAVHRMQAERDSLLERLEDAGTERDIIETENRALLTRVSELERERDKAAKNAREATHAYARELQRTRDLEAMHGQTDLAVMQKIRQRAEAAESRIESLVGEREELREALLMFSSALTIDESGEPQVTDRRALRSASGMLSSVLSSRETTDPKPTSSDGVDTKSKPGSLGETSESPSYDPVAQRSEADDKTVIAGQTDSPTCPTCGAGAKRVMAGYDTCTDLWHSTDRGKEDS